MVSVRRKYVGGEMMGSDHLKLHETEEGRQKIERLFNELDKKYPLNRINQYLKVSTELKKFGWIIPFDCAELDHFEKIIGDFHDNIINRIQYINLIDKLGLDYVNKSLQKSDAFNLIFKEIPKRKLILERSLQLYKTNDYNMCIPVLLSQIDGIIIELIKIDSSRSFFSKKDLKHIKNHTKQILNEYSRIGFDILDRVINANIEIFHESSDSLIASSWNIDEQFDASIIHSKFSRNLVLHGIDCEYGTEVNAAKCISILFYLDFSHPILSIVFDSSFARNNKNKL